MQLSEAVDHIREIIFTNTDIRTFWEGFNSKRPKETYMTVEVLDPYIATSDNKEFKYVSNGSSLERQTNDQFETTLQFKVYATEEKDCIIAFSKLSRYSAYRLRVDLQKKNIAYVDMSTLRGLINFDEDDKEVIKTFDIKIRMTDVIVDEVDYFTKVELKGSENNVI